MRVLISGGSGLIGQVLALDLTHNGNEVIILSRFPEGLGTLINGIRAEKWDARTAEGWYPLVNGADAIVNLAGESIGSQRWTQRRKRAIVKSRIESGQAIVQAVEMAAIKPRVVIQASAVGYYDDSGDKSVTEESPRGRGFLAELASEWEASTEPVERLGVRRVVIRTGVVLSQKGGALPRMITPFRFFMGGPLGNGCQWFPWIHIIDEIRAIRFLIENESARGLYNLTAPSSLNNAEFSRLLGKQLRRPSFFVLPGFMIRLMFGEMSSVLLKGPQAVPARLLQMGFVFRFPEVKQALGNLLS